MPSDETQSNPIEPRRRRISADSFRRGRSVIGVKGLNINAKLGDINNRVSNNTRKITIIKNILGYQKSELKENLASVTPQALMMRNLDNILETLRKEKQLEDKEKEEQRKNQESLRRKKEESRLETRVKNVREATKEIVAPVKNTIDSIVKAFFAILTSKFLIKLVQWMSNPENRDKIKSVVRFLTNNGPKLLAAYLLFGTRFGRAVVRLSGLLIKGAIRLGAASLFLLKKLGLKGAGGLARALLGGRGRALGTGLQLAATAGGFFALERLFGGGDDDSKMFASQDELREGGYFGSGGMPGFSGGGLVDGPYGSDEVNARLTDGEFVMSAPATAAIGPAVLEDLNAKYGGSNKPRMVNGTLMAQEGGMVNRERATQAGMFSTRIGRGVLDNIGYGSGDFMFKGLPAGVEYNPAFSGAGDKLFGLNPQGKKLTDLFGLRGAFGELADTQYFSPDLGTAMKYAGEGGSVVSMPRTSGFSSFKNPLGSNVMRGFDPSKGIEQLVRTSDSVASAAAGTTRVMNMNNPALQKMAMQGLRAGAPLARRLGRFIPFVGTALATADVADRTARGDNLGAALGGISAIPGPVGMVGAGAQIIYDAARYQGGPNRGRSGAKRAMMARQTPSVVIPEPPIRRTPQVVMMDGGTEMIGAEPSARPSIPTLPNIPICPQSANKADVCGYTRIR